MSLRKGYSDKGIHTDYTEGCLLDFALRLGKTILVYGLLRMTKGLVLKSLGLVPIDK